MLRSSPSHSVVLLASVLKPVDDTRMRGKFAETLCQQPGIEVHIAGRAGREVHIAGRTGQGAQKAGAAAGIQQHGIFSGSRVSWNRLLAQARYWRLLSRLRPNLVFVHAPELLPLTLLWQRLGLSRQFVYDIRENYALNVSTQGVYQGFVQRLLAAGLRRVEALAARKAAGIVLAEESYASELPFIPELPPERVVLLENKYQPAPGEQLPTGPRPLPASDAPLQLLFSGTISEINGVREAIALTQELRKARPGGARLTIIGFCQQPELLHHLTQLAAAHPDWLTLQGGAQPVPHAAIVAAITRADIGLLPYQPHPSTARCRPTKLFEYLAHGLPVLIPANLLWESLVRRHQAGLVLKFSQPAQAAAAIMAAELTSFYSQGLPTDVLWASEGKKLRHLLKSLG